MGLRETLEAATRKGPWVIRQDAPWSLITTGSYPIAHCGTLPGTPDPSPTFAEDAARLIALAPELAALALDMGEYLERRARSDAPHYGNREVMALLARLDQLGKEQIDE